MSDRPVKQPSTDEEMDLAFGLSKPQPTLRDLEHKIDLLGLKIDRIRSEITSAGIGALIVMALIYYNK